MKIVLRDAKDDLKNHACIECSKVPSDEALIGMVDKLMSGYMNYQPYNGAVPEDRGKRRIDVYRDHYNDMPQRKAAPDDLHLMLMRSTRPQKIGRNGVFVKIAGKQIDYINEDLFLMMEKTVYVRFDPDCLDSVRVYDMDDRFVMEVPQSENMMLPHGASKDQLALGMRQIRRYQNATKEHLEASCYPLSDTTSALALVLGKADQNLQEDTRDPVLATANLALLNQTVTGHHDKKLPLRVVPVLAFCNSGLGNIHRELPALFSFEDFRKTAAGVLVHFQGECHFLFRQIGQVGRIQFFRKRIRGYFRHQQRLQPCFKTDPASLRFRPA